jgi:hypothetical protein
MHFPPASLFFICAIPITAGAERKRKTHSLAHSSAASFSLCERVCARERDSVFYKLLFCAPRGAAIFLSSRRASSSFFCVCTVYNKSLCSQHIFLPGLTSSRGYINIHFFISARRECTYCAPHLTRSHHHP